MKHLLIALEKVPKLGEKISRLAKELGSLIMWLMSESNTCTISEPKLRQFCIRFLCGLVARLNCCSKIRHRHWGTYASAHE